MNILQIISTALDMLCLVITTVLAWVMLNKTNRTEVSFSGTPVDKKEFEKYERDNKAEHDKFFAKLDQVQFRINPIEGQIGRLREASETNTTRLVQMEVKIDRLIERIKG